MFEIMLAIFLALVCPANKHGHSGHQGTTISTLDDDTGGDKGHLPPPPPPPPTET